MYVHLVHHVLVYWNKVGGERLWQRRMHGLSLFSGPSIIFNGRRVERVVALNHAWDGAFGWVARRSLP